MARAGDQLVGRVTGLATVFRATAAGGARMGSPRIAIAADEAGPPGEHAWPIARHASTGGTT